MNRVNEIQLAVSGLNSDELAEFRQWFAEFDAAAWNRQFEDDVATGRLDALADEALCYVRGGAEVMAEMQRPPDDTPERRATFDRAASAAFLALQVTRPKDEPRES